MTKIWSPENRYKKWLDVEIAACEAMVKIGKVPANAVKNIKEKAAINVDRIDEIEKITKHDVIAFVTSLTEKVGEDGRFIHMGLTSSDVLDTALASIKRIG
jgi:Adenylosuccinate lyase